MAKRAAYLSVKMARRVALGEDACFLIEELAAIAVLVGIYERRYIASFAGEA